MNATPIESIRLTRRAVRLCVVTTAVVAGTELLLGWAFGLISIFAEGLHTAADLLDSLVALVLIAQAARPPDHSHPYGHGKFDSLASMVEGLCVGASGAWAVFSALRVLLGYVDAEPRPGTSVLVAMVLASAVYLVVSRYVLRIARQTGSPTVRAEGLHLFTHVYITAGLLAAVFVSWIGVRAGWTWTPWVDPVVALVLGVGLILLGGSMLRAGYRHMTDTALPREELDRVLSKLDQFREQFIEVHGLRSRQSGTERHIDLHLVVDGTMTVRAAHDLAHRIEAAIAADFPQVRFLVHIEPAGGDILADYAARGYRGDVIVSPQESVRREAQHP